MPSEASNYPGALDVFADQEAKKDKASKAVINRIQNAIEALEGELGTDPAGSVTDVKTRLYVCIDNDGSIRHGTSFPGSPITGQMFFRTDVGTGTLYVYSGSAWVTNAATKIYRFATTAALSCSCTGGGCTNNAEQTIDSGGDWLGKTMIIEGVFHLADGGGLSSAGVLGGSTPGEMERSTSTTASSKNFSHLNSPTTTNPYRFYGRFIWKAVSAGDTLSIGTFQASSGSTGAVTALMKVDSSGNLLMRVTLVGTTGGGNSANFRIDDMLIVREA